MSGSLHGPAALDLISATAPLGAQCVFAPSREMLVLLLILACFVVCFLVLQATQRPLNRATRIPIFSFCLGEAINSPEHEEKGSPRASKCFEIMPLTFPSLVNNL